MLSFPERVDPSAAEGPAGSYREQPKRIRVAPNKAGPPVRRSVAAITRGTRHVRIKATWVLRLRLGQILRSATPPCSPWLRMTELFCAAATPDGSPRSPSAGRADRRPELDGYRWAPAELILRQAQDDGIFKEAFAQPAQICFLASWRVQHR